MTPEHREIAAALVLDHARDIEFLSVVEKVEELGIDDPDNTIAETIHDAALKATVTVDLDQPADLDAQYAVRWYETGEIELCQTKASALTVAGLYACIAVERGVTYGPWREVTL